MTRISRRIFGQAVIAAPALALTGAVLHPAAARAAGHAVPSAQGIMEASLGAYRITALLDGMAPLGRGFFLGSDEAVDAFLEENALGPDVLPAPVNAYLLRSEDRTILIDAGMGDVDILGPGFGHMTAAMAATGVTPDDVDTVILTHAHPDHLGGLLAGGTPVFANAEVIMAEAEAAFWLDAGMMAQAPAEAQGLFQLVQGTVAAYGAQITQVADGAEVAPGITLAVSPGHTPGHSVLRIDGGDRQLVMIADTLHSADLHTAMPEVGFGFDVDPAQGVQSRLRLFDQLATDRTLIAGSHVHFPGFGRIMRNGDAYRFAPASWT